jgi:hypothetical protein
MLTRLSGAGRCLHGLPGYYCVDQDATEPLLVNRERHRHRSQAVCNSWKDVDPEKVLL